MYKESKLSKFPYARIIKATLDTIVLEYYPHYTEENKIDLVNGLTSKILYICTKCDIEIPTIILTLIYMLKLKKILHVVIILKEFKKYLISCLWLASVWLEDDSLFYSDFKNFINKKLLIELDILYIIKKLDYRLNIKREEYLINEKSILKKLTIIIL
jgi:hypothetical protein